ncbi:hypothetical protein ACQKGL_07415 [Ensifer adhaerens]|uniref:hypothetical protein n=1 Tax=Ensifer adhaerens TaxID=106592 RepID=UPI003D05AB3B
MYFMPAAALCFVSRQQMEKRARALVYEAAAGEHRLEAMSFIFLQFDRGYTDLGMSRWKALKQGSNHGDQPGSRGLVFADVDHHFVAPDKCVGLGDYEVLIFQHLHEQPARIVVCKALGDGVRVPGRGAGLSTAVRYSRARQEVQELGEETFGKGRVDCVHDGSVRRGCRRPARARRLPNPEQIPKHDSAGRLDKLLVEGGRSGMPDNALRACLHGRKPKERYHDFKVVLIVRRHGQHAWIDGALAVTRALRAKVDPVLQLVIASGDNESAIGVTICELVRRNRVAKAGLGGRVDLVDQPILGVAITNYGKF